MLHKKISCIYIFFLYVWIWFPSPLSPPPPPSPSHTVRCAPLGCLSTARSDFDICWNAQWSVQAWKDIQCFDPKPLVSFSSLFPFHQKLLCDIVLWHVGSQTKAWIYLNFQQWKTPPPAITPTHACRHPDPVTHKHTHGHIHVHTRHTEMQETHKYKKHKKGPVWSHNHWHPALSMRFQYFMSTAKMDELRGILWWRIFIWNMKTITAHVIYEYFSNHNMV